MQCLFAALLVGIPAGGVCAVVILVRGGGREVIMPYGPALCLGGLWAMLIRGGESCSRLSAGWPGSP